MFRFHFEKGKYVINKTKPAMRRSFVRSSGNIELNLSSPAKEKEGLIVDKKKRRILPLGDMGSLCPLGSRRMRVKDSFSLLVLEAKSTKNHRQLNP